MRRIGVRTGKPSRPRVATVGVVFGALLMVACGSDDAADELTAADGASTSIVEPEVEVSEGIGHTDLIAWGDQVIAAWGAYGSAVEESTQTYVSGRISDEPEVGLAAVLFDGDTQSLTSLLGALPPAPTDAAIAAVYGEFVAAVEAAQLAMEEWSDTLGADVEALQADFDELGDGSTYVTIRIARSESENEVVLACFEVQTAIAEGGGGVLDCVGSDDSDGPPPDESQAAVDPTVEATSFVDMPELGVGTYPFPVFDRALTLTFEVPVIIGTAPDAIEISFEGDDVFFVATDNIADPTDLVADCCACVIPLPDDLRPWIDQLPVKVVDEGTWSVGGIESTSTDIEFDFEAGYEGDPVVGLVGFSDGFGMPIFPDVTVRLSRVAHPEGPMLIDVYALDRTMAEFAPIAEQIVADASF